MQNREIESICSYLEFRAEIYWRQKFYRINVQTITYLLKVLTTAMNHCVVRLTLNINPWKSINIKNRILTEIDSSAKREINIQRELIDLPVKAISSLFYTFSNGHKYIFHKIVFRIKIKRWTKVISFLEQSLKPDK